MDLEHAVDSHTEWKVKLRAAIMKKASLDAAAIARDDCCELGKWLYGEAKTRWSALPAYRTCVASHTQFHQCAAGVAHAINAKRFPEADAMLGADTPYATASRDVVTAILRLKKEANL